MSAGQRKGSYGARHLGAKTKPEASPETYLVGRLAELSPARYAVFRGSDGVRVSGIYGSSQDAETACAHFARRANSNERPCFTCGTSFRSDGPHHRMCTSCRARGDHASPYSLDGITAGSRGSRRPRAS